MYGFYNLHSTQAFCCILPVYAAILLRNVRFVRIANHHILLPAPYSSQQVAAICNNVPKKKFPDVRLTIERIVAKIVSSYLKIPPRPIRSLTPLPSTTTITTTTSYNPIFSYKTYSKRRIRRLFRSLTILNLLTLSL